jgi:hypothetical protein
MTGGDTGYQDKGVWAHVVHLNDITSGPLERVLGSIERLDLLDAGAQRRSVCPLRYKRYVRKYLNEAPHDEPASAQVFLYANFTGARM